MTFDSALIRRRIEEAARGEMDLSDATARDVAFHMTDRLGDLAAFHAFCAAPDAMSNETLRDLLMSFLIHVPNHVAAAGKLYADQPVTDIFGAGAAAEIEQE